jgi:hypothetical protein
VKAQLRFAAGHLVWNRLGQVWAVYRAAPVGSVHATHHRRLEMFEQLRPALMRLPGESMLLSVGEPIDPLSVVASVLPDAAGALGRKLIALSEEHLGARRLMRRTHFVALRVDMSNAGWKAALAAAVDGVSESFGAGWSPSPATVRRVAGEAERLAAQLGSIRLTPCTTGELRWLATRVLSRDVPFDASWEPRAGRSAASLYGPHGEVRFVEGGDRRDEGRGRVGRYVRCDSDGCSIYHTCLVLAEMPMRWTFPGGAELLAYLESAAEAGGDGDVIEADVCVRIRRSANPEALRKVRRKRSKLAWQRGEYAGNITGVPGSLGSSSALLDDMQTALEANRAEPELRCTVIVHLADGSLPRLDRHATALQAQFEPANFGLVRPIGDQLRLLSMMTPGSATTPPANDFAQHLLARDLAACLPLCGGGVGDDRGGLLGTLLDTGRNQPVMIDPGRGPASQQSGNIAAVGGLGSGKSVTAKRLIETVVADGGQVITIDRTEAGEYVRYADALASCGVSTQVIRLGADTGVCLDPLRVFSGAERITVAVGFLAQLCAVETGSLEATTLAEAVESVAARPQPALSAVVDELAARGRRDAPEATVLARKLGRYQRLDAVGQAAFGAGDPLDMSASFVVVSAAGLDLVSRDVLTNEHLARRMLDAQVAAQALLYLVAAIARRSTFASPCFAAALLDEFWVFQASPYGQALVTEWCRDGRKHNAAVWLFTQHPADLPSELRDLVGMRMAFRQSSRAAAVAALEFLELADDQLADRLSRTDPNMGGFAPGMCVLCDLDRRVGTVQVHQSLHPALRGAADTTPRARPESPAALDEPRR